MAQDEEANAFDIDEDEDMSLLLEEAARLGERAVDSIDDNISAEDILTQPSEPRPKKVEAAESIPSLPQEVIEEEKTPTAPPQEESPEDLRRELRELKARSEEMLHEKEAKPHFSVPNSLKSEISSPAHTAPVSTPTPAPVSVRLSEKDEIAKTKVIIAILDAYRKLDNQGKSVAAQLITQIPEIDIEEEATIIIKALNSDELTFNTMAALKEAKAKEPVDRAFYILALPDDVRVSLGTLITAFSGQNLGDTKDILGFSRKIVEAIDALAKEAISYVVATESVLRAAKVS